MRQSNGNFNVPPPPGTPRVFDYFLGLGSGEFDLKGLPGGGGFTFALVWWESQIDFFFLVLKSITAII